MTAWAEDSAHEEHTEEMCVCLCVGDGAQSSRGPMIRLVSRQPPPWRRLVPACLCIRLNTHTHTHYLHLTVPCTASHTVSYVSLGLHYLLIMRMYLCLCVWMNDQPCKLKHEWIYSQNWFLYISIIYIIFLRYSYRNLIVVEIWDTSWGMRTLSPQFYLSHSLHHLFTPLTEIGLNHREMNWNKTVRNPNRGWGWRW